MTIIYKTGVITLLLFCLLENICAQNYFNKRIIFNSKGNATENFILLKDTFYLSTRLIDTAVPFTVYAAVLGKVASDGTIINTKKVVNYPNKYIFPNAITSIKNTIYTTGGGGYYNTISGTFNKFNANGDTVKTGLIGDTSYYCLLQKVIPYTKTKDQLLLIGTTDSTCGVGHQGSYKLIIRVVDTNGVLIQTKLFLNNCFYRNITGIDTAEDKGYLIAYGGYINTWDSEGRILKLDSNLNIVWNKQINILSEGACAVVNHKNQYYMALSTHVDSVWNFSYKWGRVSLTKLDLNGNIIWQKYYGTKERIMLPSAIKECANGDFIVSGTRQTSSNELQGWIMRTDSAGSLLWWHNYRPNTLPLDTTAQNYLYDIIELPNRDLAALGWSGGSQVIHTQQTWLLKVDSNGCFGAASCPPNLTTGIKENVVGNVGITAYPNPFKDELNINYSILDFEGTAQLQLIELASGRIIDNLELTQSFGTKQFNTQNLANGLYVLSLKRNNKPSVNFKVINIK